jgi:hypothetical protein
MEFLLCATLLDVMKSIFPNEASRTAFMRGFLRGLYAPASLFEGTAHTYPHGVRFIDGIGRSDTEALRSDWQMVGVDIRAVISKHEDQKAPHKSPNKHTRTGS